MTIVTITEPYGQLCNRLVLSAHLLAFCREHGFVFVNSPFECYADVLEITRRAPVLSWPALPLGRIGSTALRRPFRAAFSFAHRLARSRRLSRAASFCGVKRIDLGDAQALDLDSPAAAESIRRKSLVLLSGWEYRCPALVRKHSPFLRKHFAFASDVDDRAVKLAANLRSRFDVLVGVHVRQGDYRTWRNGMFFYDSSYYARQMEIAASQLGEKRVAFVVCSNEEISFSDFSSLEVTRFAGAVREDLKLLSLCDVIMGPPSSFSTWAAYAGQRPLWHLYGPGHDFELSGCEIPEMLEWPSRQFRERVGSTHEQLVSV